MNASRDLNDKHMSRNECWKSEATKHQRRDNEIETNSKSESDHKARMRNEEEKVQCNCFK